MADEYPSLFRMLRFSALVFHSRLIMPSKRIGTDELGTALRTH